MFMEPIERPNQPVDFVAKLCRAAGWNGDRAHIDLNSAHFGTSLGIHDYADILRSLGLRPVARRARLSKLTPADLPCLYQDASGTVRLVEETGRDGPVIYDENTSVPSSAGPESKRRVLVLSANKVEEQPETQSSTTLRSLMIEQRKSIIAVVLSTILINLLGLSTPLVVLTVYDTAIPTQSVNLLWALATLAAVLVVLELTLRLVRAWLIGDSGAQVERSLSRALFGKLSRMPVEKLQRASMFQQMTRLRQFDSIRDALTGSMILSCIDLPFSLVFVAVISFFSKLVGLALLGVILVYLICAAACTHWQLNAGSRAAQARGDYEALQYEIARNRAMIRNFDMIETFEARAAKALERADQAAWRQRFLQTAILSIGQAWVAVVGCAAVALTTLQAMSGAVSFGGLIVTVTLVWRVMGPLQALLRNSPKLVGLIGSLKQIDAVLSQEEELQRLGTQARSKTLGAPLAMRSVFLRFDAVHEPALSGVSLTVHPGERVALCGPARSGKTCLLNCFAKQVVPSSGAVMIGSIDYRQIAIEDIRQSVSYCTHDNWFFQMSLRDNMRMGNPYLSDIQIKKMLRDIGAINDLRRFPDGLDTVMSPSVMARLSTVQLKTLSIVRTLCRSTPVYLIDDTMVGLSSARANRIWAALEDYKQDRTIIAVTNHRDQMAKADRIICLDNGRVVLDGAGPKDALAAAKIIQRG